MLLAIEATWLRFTAVPFNGASKVGLLSQCSLWPLRRRRARWMGIFYSATVKAFSSAMGSRMVTRWRRTSTIPC